MPKRRPGGHGLVTAGNEWPVSEGEETVALAEAISQNSAMKGQSLVSSNSGVQICLIHRLMHFITLIPLQLR